MYLILINHKFRVGKLIGIIDKYNIVGGDDTILMTISKRTGEKEIIKKNVTYQV